MIPHPSRRLAARASAVLMALALSACATAPGTARDPKDPFEPFNRNMYAFNTGLDNKIIRPTAEAYVKIVPQFARTGVSNVFANVADLWSSINGALQAKPETFFQDGLRFGVNTFLGLGGLLDVAGEMGLRSHHEDFGQTLGRWGVGPGPYLVLPLLGSSDVRDTVATPFDALASPAALVNGSTAVTTGITVLQVTSARAKYLSAGKLLDDIALDKYSFVRDAYLARRRSQVYDGDPPDEPDGAPAPVAPGASAPVSP